MNLAKVSEKVLTQSDRVDILEPYQHGDKTMKATGYYFFWTGDECGEYVNYIDDLFDLQRQAIEYGNGFVMYIIIDGKKVMMP